MKWLMNVRIDDAEQCITELTEDRDRTLAVGPLPTSGAPATVGVYSIGRMPIDKMVGIYDVEQED